MKHKIKTEAKRTGTNGLWQGYAYVEGLEKDFYIFSKGYYEGLGFLTAKEAEESARERLEKYLAEIGEL